MDIKIGDKIKNSVTNQVVIASKIKHGYINGYRADLWTIVTLAEEILPVNKDVIKMDRLISGKMSISEQEQYEGEIFGTFKK